VAETISGNPRALGHPLEYARVFQAFVWCMLFQKVACPWFILLDRKMATVLRYSRSRRVLTTSFIQMISHQYQSSCVDPPCTHEADIESMFATFVLVKFGAPNFLFVI